ncbi:MAG: penicillin-binding protein 2, partial [Clostridia bacterium]|nr:penicillin-binding protein 2 [Clostridia bacterium]
MSKRRLSVVKILILVMMLAIIWRLYNMQVINGQGYKNLSDQRISANIVEKAPRGEITDRNGKALVTNRRGYSLR